MKSNVQSKSIDRCSRRIASLMSAHPFDGNAEPITKIFPGRFALWAFGGRNSSALIPSYTLSISFPESQPLPWNLIGRLWPRQRRSPCIYISYNPQVHSRRPQQHDCFRANFFFKSDPNQTFQVIICKDYLRHKIFQFEVMMYAPRKHIIGK